MAAILISRINWYIGTNAERVAMVVTGVPAGSKFFETDTADTYILDGAGVWASFPLTSALTATINANLGAEADAATADDLSDVTTTSAHAKLRRILTRQSSDAYTATIGGAAKTAEDAALGALAAYFKGAGAAFSATVGGAAKTDVETAITGLAAYFNAASAALSVVSQPGVAARTSLNAILTDLSDILAGTTGITTFPAGAKAANSVSLAEVIRYIQETNDDLLDAANDEAVLMQAFNTTTTTKNATIVLFALNAIAGPIKDVKVRFFLTADAAATFTVGWFSTRAGAPTTFVKRLIPADATIVTPAADAVYEYDFGDLAEGNQLEFRVAQDNAGAATVAIDGVLTYVR